MIKVGNLDSPASEGFSWCQIIFFSMSALREPIVTMQKKLVALRCLVGALQVKNMLYY